MIYFATLGTRRLQSSDHFDFPSIHKQHLLKRGLQCKDMRAHVSVSTPTCTPAVPGGLMTFSEQPTILFVPLECRYVTAASVPQLQSEASATGAATDNE